MANKITLTRNYTYIETPTTVKITGSNLKNKYVYVEFSNARHGDASETFGTFVTSKKITNDTSFSFSFTPSNENLDDVYNSLDTTDKLRTNVFIATSYNAYPITNYSFVSYIKPDAPWFDQEPTYIVTDNNTITLTGNTTDIINGMSTVEISNIVGTAYKGGYIKYIKVGNKNYNYDDYIQENKIIIPNLTIPKDEYFSVELIDSRGWSSLYDSDTSYEHEGYYGKIFASNIELKSYHKPIITSIEAVRDIASTITSLMFKGVYTEGYEEGIETLIPTYKYQEIKSDDSGTIENGLTNQFTITRTPTVEWEDYLAILNEYNNPHTERDENRKAYYTKYRFESGGIKELFETALKYNNKYTQEYLQQDYDSVNERYYIKSGGYTYWKAFWEDTLIAIKNIMYGSYIYGQQDKDYGIGGNYEFEVEYSSIRGDIIEGFTLDKAFNIWGYIDENTFKESVAATLLSTAIPAVDIYKDKVALHGLYDETIDDSDIQLWGNAYLNGTKINAGMLQAFKTSDTTDYNTSYAYFSPFNSNGTADVDISNTEKLTFNTKNVTYGDRTNNGVYGVTIGSGINLIKVTFHVRYLNNSSATTGVNTMVYKNSNGNSDIVFGTASFAPQNMRLTETGICYIEVEEGDFIFIGGFRATKSADVDVISINNNTSMIVEIIS